MVFMKPLLTMYRSVKYVNTNHILAQPLNLTPPGDSELEQEIQQ